MQVRIGIMERGQESALIDLYRWLLRDQDVQRHTTLQWVPASPHSGTMGVVDVINLVVGQGLTALNLALSYAAWRAARPAAPSITISVDGGSLTVHDASEETIRRIVAELGGLSEDTEPGMDSEPDTA
ncbi:hypothetical protein ABZ782_27850 [Streptomyces asoensis]|uniref:effector-associated constant component EACC1 n=1 Tax=Streptomyces asoensis TaxID=249586 RepID=UPI0033D3289D